jgi:type I restriction enzyme R subunit
MEKDEAFYKKFSEMIEETIKAFQEGRITEGEYLERILKTRDDLESGYQEGVPESVRNNPKARAFFGAVTEVVTEVHGKRVSSRTNDLLAKAGSDIAEIVEGMTIRDWKKNLDIQRQMENKIEDYLIEQKNQLGIDLSWTDMDQILGKCLKVAKHNY